MATPADQRLLNLLDKWLVSLELHAKYAVLDDSGYAKVQPWPEHQRPSRWIIDVARQKTLELRSEVQNRIDTGDAKFSDSMELMAFLANLVGAEHIERFIPLADPATERLPGAGRATAAPAVSAGIAVTGTREMPKFSAPPRAPPVSGSVPPAPIYGRGGPSEAVREQVIADAARLVQWGRKWYELAEIIANMADRPHLTDVRRILKDNKAVIDQKAGRG